jgi:hypothetical protein
MMDDFEREGSSTRLKGSRIGDVGSHGRRCYVMSGTSSTGVNSKHCPNNSEQFPAGCIQQIKEYRSRHVFPNTKSMHLQTLNCTDQRKRIKECSSKHRPNNSEQFPTRAGSTQQLGTVPISPAQIKEYRSIHAFPNTTYQNAFPSVLTYSCKSWLRSPDGGEWTIDVVNRKPVWRLRMQKTNKLWTCPIQPVVRVSLLLCDSYPRYLI